MDMWLFKNDVLIKDSGLLEGFTDFHCHLLPGVDDGVQKASETLQILQLWEEAGVKAVWMTPHIMEDIPNRPEELERGFENLKKQYQGRIELHLAAENMIDNLCISRVQEDNLLPIGKTNSHLLVETSYFNPPCDMDETLNLIMGKGYYPILAHPERYVYMNIGDYKKLKDRRILFQLNVPALVGAYGKGVQQKAEMLLEKGYYDLCATDTHSIGFVKFFLNSRLSKKTVRRVRSLIENSVI